MTATSVNFPFAREGTKVYAPKKRPPLFDPAPPKVLGMPQPPSHKEISLYSISWAKKIDPTLVLSDKEIRTYMKREKVTPTELAKLTKAFPLNDAMHRWWAICAGITAPHAFPDEVSAKAWINRNEPEKGKQLPAATSGGHLRQADEGHGRSPVTTG